VKVGSYHYIVLQFIATLFLMINAPVAGVCETSVKLNELWVGNFVSGMGFCSVYIVHATI
jgi:hypothetical protein